MYKITCSVLSFLMALFPECGCGDVHTSAKATPVSFAEVKGVKSCPECESWPKSLQVPSTVLSCNVVKAGSFFFFFSKPEIFFPGHHRMPQALRELILTFGLALIVPGFWYKKNSSGRKDPLCCRWIQAFVLCSLLCMSRSEGKGKAVPNRLSV